MFQLHGRGRGYGCCLPMGAWGRGLGSTCGVCGLLFVPRLSPKGTGAGVERDTDKRQKNEITEAQRLKTDRSEIPEPENRINREGTEVKENRPDID